MEEQVQEPQEQVNPEPEGAEPSAPAQAPSGEGAQPAEQKQEEAKPREGLLKETEPADEKQPEAKEQDPTGVLGAPENGYEFKAPEGTTFDEGTMKAFGDVAKELNLSQESVQKIIDRVTPELNNQWKSAVEKYRTEWAEQSEADKEFGGAKFRENLQGTNEAYMRFTTREFRALMKESGLDSHPEVIRVFYRLSKQTGEGSLVKGGGATPPKDDPRNFYKGLN